MIKELYKTYCFFIISFLFVLVYLQCPESESQSQNLIINGSLYGQITDQIPPVGWKTCGDVDDTPDVDSTYTFGTGSHSIEAKDGSTFVILRLRSATYQGAYAPQSHEYLSQYLMSPMQKFACYKFSLYVCTDLHMNVPDASEPNVSFPFRIKVWGSDSTCSRKKLLITSELIKDTSTWTQKQYNFITGDTAFSSILIEPYWDTTSLYQPIQRYNSLFLLDMLSLENTGIKDTIQSDTIVYKGDGETILAAKKGDSYTWNPSENLSEYNIQSPTMLGYLKHDTVIIGHSSSCPTVEIFNIKLICDSLYRNDSLRTYYYKYYKNVTLNASNGLTFDWTPKENLNAYDIQFPYLTGFDSVFIVKIYDKYKCSTTEKFEIKANCDSLIPKGQFVVLDTTLESGQPSIVLIPKYGNVTSNWSPNIWLSCDACPSPVATPMTSITYSVTIIDSFACSFPEYFKITLKIMIPNVFTPNGDGFNDNFKIIGLPEGTSIKIFDKSGILVFEANPYNETNFWSGKDKRGVALETGNYWYIINNPEIKLIKKGFVFLLR